MSTAAISSRLSLAGIVLLCSTLSWFSFTELPFLQRAELWLQDFRLGLTGSHEPVHDRIVVLAIGERTLEALAYRSPVDRGFLAEVVRILNRSGAAAVGLDLLIDQATEPLKDRELIEAIRDSRVPVTLAWVDESHQRRFFTERQRSFLHWFRDQSRAGKGLVNLVGKGVAGVVRSANLSTETPSTPGFAVAMARSIEETWLPDDPTIVYRLPPPDGGPSFPVYELRPDTLQVFPPRQWLTGKLVLVGAVRPYEDRHRTPLAVAFGANRGTLAGVILHAHVLAQLLDRRIAPAMAPLGGWAICLAMAVLGALTAVRQPALWRLALMVALPLIGYWAIALAGPFAALPVLAPAAAFLAALMACGTWLGRQERRQRRFLRQAFSRYVSPAVVEAVCQQPERLALGGERRELSFVFTDVEGFTTLSESLEPELLGELFNDYLDGVVALIFDYDGTLEKFVGDAVMTLFGAPLVQPDHACKALDFALAVDRWAREFERRQRARNVPFGRTRIGVNSGVATVGNFGGARQFSYTAHGDSVNTAARLETLNKHLGTRVCVGERTAELCPGRVLRPVGELVLKGKTEALQVFEPEADPELGRAPVELYREAYRLLADGAEDAAGRFRVLHERYPRDPLVRYHCYRLADDQRGVHIVMAAK